MGGKHQQALIMAAATPDVYVSGQIAKLLVGQDI
jgi:hypothetical protein